MVCLVLCVITLFFFGGLLFSNIWAVIVFAALLLAILITVLKNLDSKIEELEKKIQQLQNEKESPLGE